MEITCFSTAHLEDAKVLALKNYQEERSHVLALPEPINFPDLREFAENGLGVAAVEQGLLLGFLGFWGPFDNALTTTARGVFSPIHGHGAVAENRELIYRMMYEAVGKLLVAQGAASHAVSLYAHDEAAIKAFFTNGFGMRCMDAIRPMEEFPYIPKKDYSFSQLEKEHVSRIAGLRRGLSHHLGESPCFMRSTQEAFHQWLSRAETRNSKVFIAAANGEPIAFVEVTQEGGETFLTEQPDIANICGAYCHPQHRGNGVMQALLNNLILQLKREGFQILGVDYESINPTAYTFWQKSFTPYTKSLVRRIDESALMANGVEH